MSSISSLQLKRPGWQTVVIFTLTFWLSTSLVLDLVIMPGLYASGMMSQSGFATAGYLIFWLFNRIELLCAALVLTGVLVLKRTQDTLVSQSRNAIVLPIILLTIALIFTYVLTPQMSALGLNIEVLNPVTSVPGSMTFLHQSYWILEVIKLIVGGAILSLFYREK
ncbi:DUF4149 domain-containing protein [Phormidium sp. LEGE 05292]|uniref:DUF4149 domain-containing protein n=1 Tax=[Phormidium] sp. LEGE 05292 TaxID=767427 RepID=UPI00187E36ED|nr:DUF4149 domain-containing protein [Phormidium sp. LEGE 05292]MBE9225385.1 DUF4149 domain-containing protein [Phormidium sp. LEGE 05292]